MIGDELRLRVAHRREVADRVVELTLVAESGGQLPQWEPGAHIDLVLADGLIRQYSLCGDPEDTGRWRVAVLREENGRGGSDFLHTRLVADAAVLARGPRNHFLFQQAARLLFIAGGIGITPILPMIREAELAGRDWELHYGGRRRTTMPYLDETADRHPRRVSTYSEDEQGMIDLAALLATPRVDTLVYCCGPGGLLDAVERLCSTWPTGSLRIERFSSSGPAPLAVDDAPFEVEFAGSGVTATVQPGRSIVEVAEEHGIAVITSCEEGHCGTCETKVLAGEPDHRDTLLTDDEQAAGETMMICVSRCRSGRLRLDL